MYITKLITNKTKQLQIEPEITPGNHGFSMFNSGGVEVEVAEFLYTFVRMIKPKYILETGTHLGISSAFMGLGLQHNQKGQLATYEVIDELLTKAKQLWKDLDITEQVQGYLQKSLSVKTTETIDILFLDSEPQFRFDEFIHFWPNVRPGGFIIVHDLHSSLGHHGNTYHGVYDWPYGYWKDKLGDYVKNHQVQTISFPCPRGLTLFQKTEKSFEFTKYLLE